MDAEDAADLALVTEMGRSAGALALTFFRRDVTQWTKGETLSPVSEADIAVDQYLKTHLGAARPGYGWLSEETADDATRLSTRRLFVVDPIDGTRAFLAGQPDWVVSIAVVEGGVSVAACLVAPVSGEVFTAARGGGANKDGHAIATTTTARPEEARVAGAKAPLDWHLPAFAATVPRIGSLALRFARVADGTIDAAFAKEGSHDWDLAATDLIVREAGGVVVGLDGERPRYNRSALRHPSLIAAGGALEAPIRAQARRRGG